MEQDGFTEELIQTTKELTRRVKRYYDSLAGFGTENSYPEFDETDLLKQAFPFP